MIDLLGPGGRLVFYGATSGYTLTFLGKPGSAPAGGDAAARPACGRTTACSSTTARRRRDAGGRRRDQRRRCAPAPAWWWPRAPTPRPPRVQGGAPRARRRQPARRWRATAGFRWPDAMPDYDADPDGYRAYQDAHAQAVRPGGRAALLATPDNPRGNPDLIVERAGQDTLGVSTFLARPVHRASWSTSRTTADDRLSFYAPNVWMHQKRVLFPTFAILGSHLSNAHQAEEVVRLLDAGALAVAPARRRTPGTSWPRRTRRSTRTATPARSRSAWAPPPRSTARARRARCTRRGARASSTARPCACASIPCGRARPSAWRW